MSDFDFSRWAFIAPNDDTGLGRMAQDIKAVLPLGVHLVAPSERLKDRPLAGGREKLLERSLPVRDLEALLAGFQGVIFFERPTWHPELLPTARRLGVRTVCVPMWEWFRGVSPAWRNCDFFLCPNLQCLRVVNSYGYRNAAYVPWALDLTRFPQRVIKGPARHFVHNAGLVDPDDRKGTADAIAAFGRVKDPRLRLTVRMQKAAPIGAKHDRRIELHVGNLGGPDELYRTGDVFIQPSKLEGIGFMVLEAVASGMPVITLDAPPMSEWVRSPEMRARPRPFAYPAYSSAWIEHSQLRLPDVKDMARKIEWAAAVDLEPISRLNRRWAEETFSRANLLMQWERALDGVLKLPVSREIFEAPEPRMPCHRFGNRLRAKIRQITGLRIPVARVVF